MDQEFLTVWSQFTEETRAASRAILSAIESCFEDMAAVETQLGERFRSASSRELEPCRTESLRVLYQDYAKDVLLEATGRYEKLGLERRISSAFADFHASLDEAARSLPVTATISPRVLIEGVEDSTGMPWWVELVRVRDRERRSLVRAATFDGLSEATFGQRSLEGGCNLLHAQFTLSLLDPWQLVQRQALQRLRGESPEDGGARGFEKLHERWRQEGDKSQGRRTDLTGQLKKSLGGLPGQLVYALIRGPGPSVHRRQLERRRRNESYWSRQRKTVRRLVDLEIALVELGRRAIGVTSDTIDAVNQEHAAIIQELELAITSLEAWQPGNADPLPAAASGLTSAQSRSRQWRGAFEQNIRELLPSAIDSIEPVRPLPGWRKPWRKMEPARIFLDAVELATETAEEGFLSVERTHRKLLREIDRAREVVAYSLQTAGTDEPGGEQIAVEGIANALALLRHERESLEDLSSAVEPAVVEASASGFYQFQVAFELGRFSLASHLAREGTSRAGRRAVMMMGEHGRHAGRVAWTGVRGAYHWTLVKIGWLAPPIENRKPVETWGYFGDRAAAADSQLPLIYDRLFRPEPVEDLRFLIGRDDEMQAFADARDFWESGRAASVVVDGERGSGKTSLLNCAVSGPFANVPLVRVSVGERLLNPDSVRGFVASAVGVPEADVGPTLRSERRVIVIEEAERTFLRVVDGLGGIRELLSLVADTTPANLWVLSMTSEGYKFLSAAMGLRRWFSHRLHASAVTSAELREAILQRHNLSGLRLGFEAPPRKGRVREWFRQQTARVQSPEESFFDDLHELSGGVFRSAFTTWRRHIDRVEDGVLHMRYLHTPDHSRLTQALTSEDLFFLQMLLQHGSLTPEEDSRLFECPLRVSHARIEHLMARGILEQEPVAPGFRIQAEAGILVRAALNARNLL